MNAVCKNKAHNYVLWVALFIVLLVSIGWLVWAHYHQKLDNYPVDAWWWEGSVGDNQFWLGDQDLLTSDGYYLVLDRGPNLAPGDQLFILHATNSDSESMTYHCMSRDRTECYPISLVITFPLDTHTISQGFVHAVRAHPSHLDHLKNLTASSGASQ